MNPALIYVLSDAFFSRKEYTALSPPMFSTPFCCFCCTEVSVAIFPWER